MVWKLPQCLTLNHIQQYHQVPHKIRDNFIYSTCKMCFEDKLLNTKCQKCSKHDDNLLTLHSGCCFWLVILILKTKSCTMTHLNRKKMTMYLWGQTDETSFNSLKGHFGTQKKNHPAQVQSWNCSSHQRVFFHESLPAATSCHKLSLTESLQTNAAGLSHFKLESSSLTAVL